MTYPGCVSAAGCDDQVCVEVTGAPDATCSNDFNVTPEVEVSRDLWVLHPIPKHIRDSG